MLNRLALLALLWVIGTPALSSETMNGLEKLSIVTLGLE